MMCVDFFYRPTMYVKRVQKYMLKNLGKVRTMKDEHTPTPYTCQLMDTQWIVLAGDVIVVSTVSGNDQANAEFIVRAANNHARLVEACKEVTAGLQIALANLNRGVSSTTIGQLNKIRYDVETIVAKVEK